MKKFLISALMLGMFLFVLCGCGGSPLEKAYDSISALSGEGSEDPESQNFAEPLVQADYDADNEVLVINIENGAKLDPVFKSLNEAIEGEDIGTLIFTLSGTKGDDYEKDLIKKIGNLSCASMERIGLNFAILDYEAYDWLALADKTDKIYIDSNMNVLYGIEGKNAKQLSKFKDVQVSYDSVDRLGGIGKLTGAETISIVPTYVVELGEDVETGDPVAELTEDNPYLNGGEDSASEDVIAETEETSEAEENAQAAMQFDFFASSEDGVEELADMKNLNTLLIFPETGYTLSASGETFIKSLQLLKPDLQINAPEKAGTDNLVAVTEIETPNITEGAADDILEGFLKEAVEDVYNECDGYKKADGKAVLNGKALIYKADPGSEDWGESKKFSAVGEVEITGPKEAGISVPQAIGDYDTFVYIYPTYTRTGVYTSGTKAYSQTLHVQVFDMASKVQYDAETVGTEPAPQQFSYFAGSVPDKHSGQVSIEKVYDYLKGLSKK